MGKYSTERELGERVLEYLDGHREELVVPRKPSVSFAADFNDMNQGKLIAIDKQVRTDMTAEDRKVRCNIEEQFSWAVQILMNGENLGNYNKKNGTSLTPKQIN